MVEVTTTTVEVSVLDANHEPVTWAYRNGETSEVTSDLQYVDQSTFEVSRFNISNVGALFRAAEGQSGSAQNQSLTIVDYSGGEVMMSVSTVPESRTVFFEPSGALLAMLDFDTPGGIAAGLTDAVGTRATVSSITIQSTQGVWVDYRASARPPSAGARARPGADDHQHDRPEGRTAPVPRLEGEPRRDLEGGRAGAQLRRGAARGGMERRDRRPAQPRRPADVLQHRLEDRRDRPRG